MITGIQKLAKYRIIVNELSNVGNKKGHRSARHRQSRYIDMALQAYQCQRDYDTFDSLSRQAWAYEAKCLPAGAGYGQ